jgi:Flp pilus assembly protein TadD
VDFFKIKRLKSGTSPPKENERLRGFKQKNFRTMTNLLRKALLLAAFVYAQTAGAQTRADGLAAMQLEDWDKAISIYTALTKAAPTDQDALLTLSNAYLAKGDKAKALEVAQAAAHANTESPMAYVANARVALLEGNTTVASEQFKRAASKVKKDINGHRQIGESYLYYIPVGSTRPDLTRAAELLIAAYNVNSKDVPTLMALGYAYKEQGNGGMAAQQYELAEQLDPKSPLPKLMLAKVYKAAKIPAKFESNIDKAIAVSPNYTPALRLKAEHFYYGRKWEQATQAYKDLVKNGAEVKIEDEMQLANCLFITKDCKGTSELVDKILVKDPSKNYLRRLKAYCDYENGQYHGDFQRGLELLEEFMQTATPDKIIPRDWEYRGKLVLKTKGDTLVALGYLKKAIELDSLSWPLWKDPIAKIYYAKRMNCEASQAFEMYYDSVPAPDKGEAADIYYWGLAQFYCKDDSLRYEHAEQTFKKVTELMPDAGIGWLWAGKAAYKLDPTAEDIEANPAVAVQFGKGRVYAEKYVEIAWADKEKNKKDLITACNYLAYCYFVKNEKENFDAIIAKWLEIDPENPTIKEMQDAFGKEMISPTPGSGGTSTPVPGSGGGGGTPAPGGGGKDGSRH